MILWYFSIIKILGEIPDIQGLWVQIFHFRFFVHIKEIKSERREGSSLNLNPSQHCHQMKMTPTNTIPESLGPAWVRSEGNPGNLCFSLRALCCCHCRHRVTLLWVCVYMGLRVLGGTERVFQLISLQLVWSLQWLSGKAACQNKALP